VAVNRQIKSQKGISLLELLFAILVVTTVIFMATRYVKVGQDGANVTKAITQIRTVVEASYDWVRVEPNFCGKGNFADHNCLDPAQQLSLQKLVDSKLLPKEYDNKDISPWRSEMIVAPQGLDELKITIKDVPETACLALEGRLRSDKQDKDTIKCIMASGNKGQFEGVF